jgi:kynureninase
VQPTERAFAEALDAADPLAHYRDQFVITDPDLCYLDGNSLGGFVATRYALARPERVRGLVLLSPAGAPSTQS